MGFNYLIYAILTIIIQIIIMIIIGALNSNIIDFYLVDEKDRFAKTGKTIIIH